MLGRHPRARRGAAPARARVGRVGSALLRARAGARARRRGVQRPGRRCSTGRSTLLALAAQFVFDFLRDDARGARARRCRRALSIRRCAGLRRRCGARADRPAARVRAARPAPAGAPARAAARRPARASSRASAQARIDHALELAHAYRGTALLLGDVIEADDEYTGAHSRDVVDLVRRGRRRARGSTRDERRDAEFVALLHDVGKIRIPNEIINKPGPLDAGGAGAHEDAHDRGRGDARAGRRRCSATSAQLVRSCHERWDGGGYPDGLAGERDPARRPDRLLLRRLQRDDDRPPVPRGRWPPRRRSRSCGAAPGTHFDPRVVDALARGSSSARCPTTSTTAATAGIVVPTTIRFISAGRTS